MPQIMCKSKKDSEAKKDKETAWVQNKKNKPSEERGSTEKESTITCHSEHPLRPYAEQRYDTIEHNRAQKSTTFSKLL